VERGGYGCDEVRFAEADTAAALMFVMPGLVPGIHVLSATQ
jgi:hypothetical protein